ncbi:MgtC/SapB family protein [Phenylobacterium sp.]|uniref:MgtC/SapB family protein n=1 Tax=Phenylobacterium sp. TaxID=1871053 RepID=UPI003918B440
MALGVGLLIGAERERRKLQRGAATAAGIRTFAITALAGALSRHVGGALMVAVATAAVGVFVALGYWRTRKADEDPGLTTEIALVVTVLLGALAMSEPAMAAAAGVAVAIILAGRTQIHHFVGAVLTEREVRGALLLAAATLIVLPLLPDRPMGPFEALNPHAIWLLVVLVLAIGAAGHVAVRALGVRFGLPVTGLASGFVSSAATIGAMGARAAKAPAVLAAAVAGAVLSTVATVVQMTAVLAAVSVPTLQAMAGPLLLAGAAAGLYGAVFTIAGLRQKAEEEERSGEAFSLLTALAFGAILAAVMLGSAALRAWFGEAGSIAAAALAGFADTHAAAISVAAQVATGHMEPSQAILPILAAFTTNSITKLVVAATTGGRAFALRVIPGLILVTAGAWAGALLAL